MGAVSPRRVFDGRSLICWENTGKISRFAPLERTEVSDCRLISRTQGGIPRDPEQGSFEAEQGIQMARWDSSRDLLRAPSSGPSRHCFKFAHHPRIFGSPARPAANARAARSAERSAPRSSRDRSARPRIEPTPAMPGPARPVRLAPSPTRVRPGSLGSDGPPGRRRGVHRWTDRVHPRWAYQEDDHEVV